MGKNEKGTEWTGYISLYHLMVTSNNIILQFTVESWMKDHAKNQQKDLFSITTFAWGQPHSNRQKRPKWHCKLKAKGSVLKRPTSLKHVEETKMTVQTQGVCFKRPTSLKHVEETKMTVQTQGVCFKRPTSLKQTEETKMTLQTQGVCFKRPCWYYFPIRIWLLSVRPDSASMYWQVSQLGWTFASWT